MLKVEKIRKVYTIAGRCLPVLEDVSFETSSGECLALFGPSGSGKTTLLNIIGCMCRPSSGRVVIDGREVTSLPEHFLVNVRREKIGFIFQRFHLFPDLSVRENLVLPLVPLGLSPGGRKKRAEKALERFGLLNRMESRVSELSGGEQQRVAVARALVNDPDIILADEPTSNMDAANCRLVLDALVELKNRGRVILVASHDPLVLQSGLADRTYPVGRED